MKTKVLNVPFDVVTNEQALKIAMDFLKKDKNHTIFTPNPEIVMEAQQDLSFMKILKEADLIIPDGIGVVMASKLNKVKLKERVAGCDLVFSLFEEIKNKEYTVYIVGGRPGVAEQAKMRMEEKYKGIKIVGTHSGYFDEKEEKKIVDEIKEKKPHILLVGLSAPKQEKWIYRYKKEFPVKISMGVGGSIDVMAGTVKRAPKIYQKTGLEWLYRFASEPSRIKRMIRLPLFVIEVIKEKIIFGGRRK